MKYIFLNNKIRLIRTSCFSLTSLMLTILFSVSINLAQGNLAKLKIATKIDEYRYGSNKDVSVNNDCDIDAHLDNFAYGLRQEHNARGYMISYHGISKQSKYFAFNPLWQFRHLNFEYSFEKGRVTLIDGGYREEAMMELWIVPEGANVPVPTPTVFSKERKRNKKRGI